MNSISYVRAIGACMPVIGPVVSLYNAYQGRKELSSCVSRITHFANYRLADENKINQLPGLAEVFERNLPYSVCGLVGSVWTVAMAVKLATLGILTGGLATAVVSGLVCLALFHAIDSLSYAMGPSSESAVYGWYVVRHPQGTTEF